MPKVRDFSGLGGDLESGLQSLGTYKKGMRDGGRLGIQHGIVLGKREILKMVGEQTIRNEARRNPNQADAFIVFSPSTGMISSKTTSMVAEDHGVQLGLGSSLNDQQLRRNFNQKVYGKSNVPQPDIFKFVRDSRGDMISRRPKSFDTAVLYEMHSRKIRENNPLPKLSF